MSRTTGDFAVWLLTSRAGAWTLAGCFALVAGWCVLALWTGYGGRHPFLAGLVGAAVPANLFAAGAHVLAATDPTR